MYSKGVGGGQTWGWGSVLASGTWGKGSMAVEIWVRKGEQGRKGEKRGAGEVWGESYLGEEEDLLERGAGDVLPGPGNCCSMG